MVLCWRGLGKRGLMAGEVALGVVIRGREGLETQVWASSVVAR